MHIRIQKYSILRYVLAVSLILPLGMYSHAALAELGVIHTTAIVVNTDASSTSAANEGLAGDRPTQELRCHQEK